MTQKLSELIDRLQQANVQLRQQLELAEAQVPKLNDSLVQMTNLGFCTGGVVLGDIILSTSYAAEGPSDSGQLYQAAIIVPGGIGAILWDALVYEECSRQPEGLETEARTYFIPFDRCSPGMKSLLFRCVEPLVTRLFHDFGLENTVCRSELPTT